MVSNTGALGALVLSVFCSIFLVNGQSGGVARSVILNSDPQILYEPTYCTSTSIFECMGAWWDTTLNDGSVIKTSAGPSSQYKNAQNALSYSFYGSSLELHGLLDAFGANMIVQIDNALQMVNTSTGTGGGSEQPSILGNYTNLDPQVIHTLSIGWSANDVPDASTGVPSPLSYAYFDHLVIDNFRNVDDTSSAGSATSSGPTSTPTTALSSAPSKSMKFSPGVIAGLVIALILFIALFCVSSYFILRNRRRAPWWRRSNSQHVRVMIESYEDRGSDRGSPPVSAWKARPHLSLPPASFPPAYARPSISTSEGAEYGDIKGESYLDLESGSSKSRLDGLSSSVEDLAIIQDDRKGRLSFLYNPLSPLHSSPRMSYPPRAKLRINTRESTLSPRNDPFAGYSTGPSRDEQADEHLHLPPTPYTSYVVETATMARTQSAQVISKAELSDCEGLSSSQTPMPPLPPLPPLPTPSEEKEKRRRTKVRSGINSHRSRVLSRVRSPEAVDAQVSDALRQLSNPFETGIGSRAGNARPSLDAMSIMTRSVPPPYALHL